MIAARGLLIPIFVVAAISVAPVEVWAQAAGETSAATAEPTQVGPNTLNPITIDNPLGVVEDAANAIPGFEGGISSTINIMILLTVLTLAPSIMIMCTCFTRIVIVLASAASGAGHPVDCLPARSSWG